MAHIIDFEYDLLPWVPTVGSINACILSTCFDDYL